MLIVQNHIRTNPESPFVLPLIGVHYWLYRVSTRQQLPAWIAGEIYSHIDTTLAAITHPLFDDMHGPFFDYYADMKPIYQRVPSTNSFAGLVKLATRVMGEQLNYIVVYMYEPKVLDQLNAMRKNLIRFIRLAERNHYLGFTQASWLAITSDYWLIITDISKLYSSLETCGLRIAELDDIRYAATSLLPIHNGSGFIQQLSAAGCSIAFMDTMNNRVESLNNYLSTFPHRRTTAATIGTQTIKTKRLRTSRTVPPKKSERGIWKFLNRMYHRIVRV